MPAGLTQITILDGAGNPKQLQVWSSDGTLGGNLSFLQQVAGLDQVNPAGAANPLPVTPKPFAGVPKGYQQLTGMSASTALTVPAGATYALIQAEAQIVRWRDDGVAPTGSVGMTLAAGAAPQVFAGDLSALRFIQATSGAILNVSYYG